jgi:hypothetical protein
MRLKLAAAVVAAYAWSSADAAELQDFQVNTVDQIARLCGASPSSDLYVEAIQFCYGYISGAVQFHNSIVGARGIQPIACPPASATREEFARYFANWAESTATPEQRAEPAIQGMARAAALRYPCPR